PRAAFRARIRAAPRQPGRRHRERVAMEAPAELARRTLRLLLGLVETVVEVARRRGRARPRRLRAAARTIRFRAMERARRAATRRRRAMPWAMRVVARGTILRRRQVARFLPLEVGAMLQSGG